MEVKGFVFFKEQKKFKGMMKERVISRKCLFKDKSSSLENLCILFYVGDVVSPPTPIFNNLSVKLMPRHLKICKIYDRQKYLQ